MPTGTPDERFAQARKLEAEAVEAGDEEAHGRELRAQAAKLRVQALGETVYPVVVCSSCFRVTGWVAADGLCDACLRHAQVEAAYADPHGGWVSLADTRQPLENKPDPLPLGARIAALAGRRAGLERAEAVAWLKWVDPDQTGPISPEDGYELEVAHRGEVAAADGSGILIRFTAAAHRFADGAWLQLETSKIGRGDLLAPAEFSAGLPIEQLAEAWADYQAAVEIFNRGVWERQSQAREAARQVQEAGEETLRQQQHVSELLDESR